MEATGLSDKRESNSSSDQDLDKYVDASQDDQPASEKQDSISKLFSGNNLVET